MKNLLNLSYLKIVTAAILITVGVASGIYVGYKLLGVEVVETKASAKADNMQKSMDDWDNNINIELGNLFPREEIILPDGSTDNFENILNGKKTILFFSSVNCGKCTEIHNFWQSVVAPVADKNLQVLICIDKSEMSFELSEQKKDFLKDKILIYYDQQLWVEKYDLQIIPSVVGIDNHGFVQAIQTGFHEKLTTDIMKFSSRLY